MRLTSLLERRWLPRPPSSPWPLFVPYTARARLIRRKQREKDEPCIFGHLPGSAEGPMSYLSIMTQPCQIHLWAGNQTHGAVSAKVSILNSTAMYNVSLCSTKYYPSSVCLYAVSLFQSFSRIIESGMSLIAFAICISVIFTSEAPTPRCCSYRYVKKGRRIGCVISHCNLQLGITQPILRLF